MLAGGTHGGNPRQGPAKRRRQDGDRTSSAPTLSNSTGKRKKTEHVQDMTIASHVSDELQLVAQSHPQAQVLDRDRISQVTAYARSTITQAWNRNQMDSMTNPNELADMIVARAQAQLNALYNQTADTGQGQKMELVSVAEGNAFAATGYLAPAGQSSGWLRVYAYAVSPIRVYCLDGGRRVTVSQEDISRNSFVYFPTGPRPIPSDKVAHANPESLRPARRQVNRLQATGRTDAMNIIKELVSQEINARNIEPVEGPSGGEGTALQVQRVAQQLTNQGMQVQEVMRQSTGQMMEMMKMQQHFAGQTRDRQMALMNSVLSRMAMIQQNQSSELVQQMRQQGQALARNVEDRARALVEQGAQEAAARVNQSMAVDRERHLTAQAQERTQQAVARVQRLQEEVRLARQRPERRSPPPLEAGTPEYRHRSLPPLPPLVPPQPGMGVAVGLGAALLAVVAMSR